MSGQRRYKRLVVPGRFQPPHWGHVKTVEYALSLSDEVLVVIGSAQESFTLRNPLTAGERFELLEKLFSGLWGSDYYRRIKVIPVLDINSHKMWVQYLRMLLPRFEGVVSGNPLVRMLFEDMGMAALEPPMYRRSECSGTVIRERILRGDPGWRECIPEAILEDLEAMGFERRIRELAEEG